MEHKKLDLKALSLDQLGVAVKEWGLPSFTAKQIWRWIYEKGETDINHMTDLSVEARRRLEQEVVIPELAIAQKFSSRDGTVKYLLQGYDGQAFESVYLPTRKESGEYNTVCVSTQVGCAVKCPFCATGQMGFSRNLRTAEIVDQIHVIEHDQHQVVRNVVLMGMGEPLLNYEETIEAVRIWREVKGLSWKRITLSTSGYLPGLQRLVEEKVPVRLALSLHAPVNALRDILVPLNKKYPLGTLLPLCKAYSEYSGSSVTFEYVLLKDVNDSLEMAEALVKLASQVSCKINIIPWNAVGQTEYQRPGDAQMNAFVSALRQKGVLAHLRRERGSDIQAACGQLKLEHV